MSVSAKAGPWLELIPLDAVTFGTKRTCRAPSAMSAFGGKADIDWMSSDVCF